MNYSSTVITEKPFFNTKKEKFPEHEASNTKFETEESYPLNSCRLQSNYGPEKQVENESYLRRANKHECLHIVIPPTTSTLQQRYYQSKPKFLSDVLTQQKKSTCNIHGYLKCCICLPKVQKSLLVQKDEIGAQKEKEVSILHIKSIKLQKVKLSSTKMYEKNASKVCEPLLHSHQLNNTLISHQLPLVPFSKQLENTSVFSKLKLPSSQEILKTTREEDKQRNGAENAPMQLVESFSKQVCINKLFKRSVILGEGTYGVVYKAIKRDTGELVALKKLRWDSPRDGIPATSVREVAILRLLNHPNIVKLNNVHYQENTSSNKKPKIFLEFEFLELDLRKYMKMFPKRQLPIKTIRYIIFQILKALEYSHSRQIVRNTIHRDIKPNNILLSIQRSGKRSAKKSTLPFPFSQRLRRVEQQLNESQQPCYFKEERLIQSCEHPFQQEENFILQKSKVAYPASQLSALTTAADVKNRSLEKNRLVQETTNAVKKDNSWSSGSSSNVLHYKSFLPLACQEQLSLNVEQHTQQSNLNIQPESFEESKNCTLKQENTSEDVLCSCNEKICENHGHDIKKQTWVKEELTKQEKREEDILKSDFLHCYEKQSNGVFLCHESPQLQRHSFAHLKVKLADFGLARIIPFPSRPMTHEVVTLWYRAPEILLGYDMYTTAIDMWSMGCLFAELLFGRPLFSGELEIDTLFKIFQLLGTPTRSIWDRLETLPHYNPAWPQWPKRVDRYNYFRSDLDTLGKDLIDRLLCYDPQKRITASKAIQHAWFDSVRFLD